MIRFCGCFIRNWYALVILIGAFYLNPNQNGYSQITSAPIIYNYNVSDYGGSMSNFGIAQDDQGVLYFGNLDGVVKFNGNVWKLLNTRSGKAVFDLEITNDNQLLVGGYGEYGYFNIDGSGKEVYELISDSLVAKNSNYRICTIQEKTFIIGRDEVIQFKRKNMVNRIPVTIDYSGESYFVHNQQFYILDKIKGLCVIKNDRLTPIDHNGLISNERIVSHAVIENATFLLCRSGKIIVYQDEFVEYPILNGSIAALLEENIPISMDINKIDEAHHIAIGTQKNGIYYVYNHELQYNINQLNGLVNNDVRDVHFTGNVLWASTQNGISRIDGLDKWKHWNPKNQDMGLIWEMIKFEGDLYISTTKGVYRLANDVIERIGNSANRSYNFFKLKNRLYVNNFNYINRISNGEITKTFETDKPNFTQVIDNNTVMVISFAGIFIITFDDDGDVLSSIKISEFGGMSFSGTQFKNEYWFTIINSGLFKLTINDGKYNVVAYSTDHGLPPNSDYEVFVYDDKLIVGSGNGFYTLSDSLDSGLTTRFVRYLKLNEEHNEVYYPSVGANGNLWFASKDSNHLEIIKKGRLLNGKIELSTPLKVINNQGVTKILPDPEEPEIVWVATSQGLYRYKDSNKISNESTFNTVFSSIHNNDSILFHGTFGRKGSSLSQIVNEQTPEYSPTFEYNRNNIAFHYSSTNYESPELTQYSYRLEGYNDDWSTWSTSTSKEYTNLNSGTYRFHVKSKNLNSIEGATISYEFTILPPWYQELWATVLFAIIGVTLIWLILFIYTLRLRNNRQYLTKMVAEKTEELHNRNEEIEEQNKILVAQKKQIEQANIALKASNDTKDKLFSIISHDLKSPLNSLTAFSNILVNHAQSMTMDEIVHLAKDFDKSLNNTYNLLINLLEWSRSQSNKIELQPAPINMAEIIQEGMELLDSQSKDKNIAISANLEKDLYAFADINTVKMVIRNLLSNAIKFTHPNGHIELSIKHENDFVVTSFTDSGIGISEEVQDKLFKIDSKYSAEGTAKEKGTGLGLILCKEFVEKNGGKLWMESEEGKGSTFYFSLPTN